MAKNLDELIKEKTKNLNGLVQQIGMLRQQLNRLNTLALKLDGAIVQLKELKKVDKSEK